jgi:hypothetical protein
LSAGVGQPFVGLAITVVINGVTDFHSRIYVPYTGAEVTIGTYLDAGFAEACITTANARNILVRCAITIIIKAVTHFIRRSDGSLARPVTPGAIAGLDTELADTHCRPACSVLAGHTAAGYGFIDGAITVIVDLIAGFVPRITDDRSTDHGVLFGATCQYAIRLTSTDAVGAGLSDSWPQFVYVSVTIIVLAVADLWRAGKDRWIIIIAIEIAGHTIIISVHR